MSEEKSTSANNDKEHKHIPIMQQILDNPFLLLFLGVTIPTVCYLGGNGNCPDPDS